MCNDDSPLFLAIRYNIDDFVTDRVWYHPRRLGKKQIGEFLSKARACLESSNPSTSKGKISNHSARKTTITNLLHSNINTLHVQQLSGHKKLESLNNYNVPSAKQQHFMSNIIGGATAAVQQQVHTQQNSANQKNTTKVDFTINNDSVISPTLEKELSKPWDPVSALFSGATFNNCTISIAINSPTSTSSAVTSGSIQPPKPKRRRLVIYDSTDSESE